MLDASIRVVFYDTFKQYLNLYGHKLPVLTASASSDGALLVSGGADKTVKIWGLDFGDCHRSLLAHQVGEGWRWGGESRERSQGRGRGEGNPMGLVGGLSGAHDCGRKEWCGCQRRGSVGWQVGAQWSSNRVEREGREAREEMNWGDGW